MLKSRWLWAAAGFALLAAALANLALLSAAATPNPTGGSELSIARGDARWKLSCQPCHGPQGRGDGPAASSLRRQPKDLTRIARPPIFPDGVMAYRIANGGEGMPAWRDSLDASEIWDLVSFIRAQRRE